MRDSQRGTTTCADRLLPALVLLAGLLTVSRGVRGDEPEISHSKFLAQQAALDALQGEDPFILRESWWNGRIEPGEAKLIQQQLFKNNTYHYWLAVPNPKALVYLNIYDGEGRLLETQTVRYAEGKHVVGMIVTPRYTGIYYLRIALDEETASGEDWALIYAYR